MQFDKAQHLSNLMKLREQADSIGGFLLRLRDHGRAAADTWVKTQSTDLTRGH